MFKSGDRVDGTAATRPFMDAKIEVTPDIREKEGWMVWVDGVPCSATWNSHGAAEAEADLIRSGYRKPQFSTEVAPFPHERSCRHCWRAHLCNYCGQTDVRPRTGACTNGRCADCCRQHCRHQTH